jgi:hypothetical protein
LIDLLPTIPVVRWFRVGLWRVQCYRGTIVTGGRFSQGSKTARSIDGHSTIEGTKGNRWARHARVQAWGAQNQPRQKGQQAVAIGLHEAGASTYQSNEKNRRNLQRTKARERGGAIEEDRNKQGSGREPTRSQLYEEAKRQEYRRVVAMNKDELERALHG